MSGPVTGRATAGSQVRDSDAALPTIPIPEEPCMADPTTPDPDLPRIRILSGSMDGLEVVVPADGCVLGRGPGTLVAFRAEIDLLLSRRHAAIGRDAAGIWWIEDLGSTNGTWFGTTRVVGRAAIPTSENEFSLGASGSAGSVSFYVAFPSLRRAARAQDPPRASVRSFLDPQAAEDP